MQLRFCGRPFRIASADEYDRPYEERADNGRAKLSSDPRKSTSIALRNVLRHGSPA
jgi:hypothetical protein